MSAGWRGIRVIFQEGWRAPGRRGLLDAEPRVQTLCRVLVSYPEVRHVLPDRVSVDQETSVEMLETVARFLERQRWLVTKAEVV